MAAVAGQPGDSLAEFFSRAAFGCVLADPGASTGCSDSDTFAADDTYSASWMDGAGGTVTVTNSILSSLTTTVTFNADGSASFAETLTSSFDFFTTYVSPGPLNYTSHTWGFYNYTLSASHGGPNSGNGGGFSDTSYTLDFDGSHSYSFDRANSVATTGADNSLSVDIYSYVAIGTDNFISYRDSSMTYASDGSTTQVDHAFGNGDGWATYSGANDFTWFLAAGDVTAGDGTSTTCHDATSATSWSNYDYNYLDILTTTVGIDGSQTLVGTTHDEGVIPVGRQVAVDFGRSFQRASRSWEIDILRRRRPVRDCALDEAHSRETRTPPWKIVRATDCRMPLRIFNDELPRRLSIPLFIP